MLATGPAPAQEELREDRQVEEREVEAGTMSEDTYKRLSRVHEQLGEEDYAGALDGLRRLEDRRLNDYERALVYQTYGFVFASQGKIRESIKYFERTLALDSLPNEAQQGMLFSLAQLYSSVEEYQKTIETMRTWFRYEADPVAEAYMVMGYAHFNLGKPLEALPYVQKAIEKSEKPKEPWYQLELSIYLDQGRYADAARILERMINLWPNNPQYWEALAGSYMELQQDSKALSTLMVAYTKGILNTQAKILNVVRLNMFMDIPHTAGKILAKAIAEGKVEPTQRNLDLLLSAWQASREYDEAVKVIDRLAQVSGEPKYYMDKAHIFNERAQWEEVAAAARQALDSGYEDRAEAWMLIGTAYSEMNRFRDSIAAFEKVKQFGDAKQRRNAQAWILFVQDRLSVQQARISTAAAN